MNEVFSFLKIDIQIYQILLALFLGAFIGLRREMLFQKRGIKGVMGIRTVSTFVLLGTLSTFFPDFHYLPVLIFAGIFIFLLIAYYNGVFNLKRIGLTSELSSMIMYWVGVLVGYEKFLLAIILTAIIGFLTSYKESFHKFAKDFSMTEWNSALQLLILSAIILPLLPNEEIDPFGIINPYKIWLLVIFISAIGFFGYFFDKYFSKKKSIFLTSIFGSLASSTATTIALAGKSKKKSSNKKLLAFGLFLSISTMQARVMLMIVLLSGGIYLSFIVPALIIFLSSVFFALFFWRKSKGEKNDSGKSDYDIKIESPFKIIPALKFTLLFIIILYAIYFAEKYFNSAGAYFVATLASLADADMIILSSLETFSAGSRTVETTAILILIPVVINTLIKSFYIYLLGDRGLFKITLIPVLIVSFMGVLGYFSVIFNLIF